MILLRLWGQWTVAVAVAPVATPYAGKYRAEHAGALAALGAAQGFSAEHAGALSAVREAGV